MTITLKKDLGFFLNRPQELHNKAFTHKMQKNKQAKG